MEFGQEGAGRETRHRSTLSIVALLVAAILLAGNAQAVVDATPTPAKPPHTEPQPEPRHTSAAQPLLSRALHVEILLAQAQQPTGEFAVVADDADLLR